jgi:two-component system nitrogen regulation response regulator NtrX
MTRVMIVDDEANVAESLKTALELHGFEVTAYSTGSEALESMDEDRPAVVMLDMKMPEMNGIDVLRGIMDQHGPHPAVIMMSAYGSVETAVEAMRLGASDFLEKPLGTERTVATIRNVVKMRELERENIRLQEEVSRRHNMVGVSRKMQKVFDQIDRAAPSEGRVLITGESGTGKELVARAIHRMSPRAERTFVTVNCAAIPAELIESELFGHEKGAFTGASARRSGKFALADGGTLFLDEIGDMPVRMQAKLLRVLESGEYQRVGSDKMERTDARIISATNKDLQKMIDDGEFRLDLFHRLNVIPIHIPSLRERPEDIPILIDWFLEATANETGRMKYSIEEGAVRALSQASWPGNVRELRNIVERLTIMAAGDVIIEKDVLSATGADSIEKTGMSLKERVRACEKAAIIGALRRSGWRVPEAAGILGIERSHLYKKMKLYKISTDGETTAGS